MADSGGCPALTHWCSWVFGQNAVVVSVPELTWVYAYAVACMPLLEHLYKCNGVNPGGSLGSILRVKQWSDAASDA